MRTRESESLLELCYTAGFQESGALCEHIYKASRTFISWFLNPDCSSLALSCSVLCGCVVVVDLADGKSPRGLLTWSRRGLLTWFFFSGFFFIDRWSSGVRLDFFCDDEWN